MSTSSRQTTARTVLRYWLDVLRHEEAMDVGLEELPRPSPTDANEPDLVQPSRVQAYVDLPVSPPGDDDPMTPFLLREETRLERPFDGTLRGLFERWLQREYRRRFVEETGRGAPVDDLLVRVGFPVVRWRHRGGRFRRATLLDVPVRSVRWRDTVGRSWKPPGWRERRAGDLPPPPVGVHIVAEAWRREEGAPPLLLNVGVLRRALKLDAEAVSELLGAWDDAADDGPEAALDTLVEWLGGADPELPPVHRVVAALGPWLEGRSVYAGAGAMAFDAASGSYTAKLQEELRILAQEDAWPLGAEPLRHYLTGEAPKRSRGLHLGLRRPDPLTPDQLAASETSLATPLVAVEGPPGTGKTHLILELAARALVDTAEALLSNAPGDATHRLLVTSVNNRAVDNVLDPLTLEEPSERLPFALRVGNRAVLADRTVASLERAAEWIRQHPEPPVPLADARERFEALLVELRERFAPVERWRRGQERRAELAEQLAEAERTLAGVGDAPSETTEPPEGPDPDALRDVQRRVDELEEALEALYDRVEEAEEPAGELARAWAEGIEGLAEEAAVASEPLGFQAAPRGLPEGSNAVDALFERIGQVGAWRRRVDEAVQSDGARREAVAAREAAEERVRELRAALEGLEDPGEAPDEAGLRRELAPREHALFEAARDLRESWAATHRERLLRLIPSLKRAAEGETSWRSILVDHPDARLLGALFPVVGGTLLSLAHTVPLEPGAVETLVIDEAGQCPPPHAVPALYRAERGLVVGDVHQLEPVITLPEREERSIREALPTPIPEEYLPRVRVVSDGGASAQRLAQRAFSPILALTHHYRCQPEIIRISGRLCDYDLEVHTARRDLSDRVPWLQRPVGLFAVSGIQSRSRGTWENVAEAERVVDMVGDLLRCGVAASRIAVLTPYRGQARRLWGMLRARDVPLQPAHAGETSQALLPGMAPVEPLLLGTIHRLQGGERDVVLLSTVATEPSSLGWLNRRPNLVNVAVSRARLHLVTVGDPQALRQGRYTRELVDAVADGSFAV